MKIEKLHTLSQFIDKIQNRRYQKYLEFYNDYNEFSLSNLGLIFRYNEFLKRPINQDMFLNPNGLEPPKCREDKCDGYFEADFERWEKAESGVIFKGWVSHDNDYLVLHEKNKERVLSIIIDDVKFLLNESNEMHNGFEFEVKTIGEISELLNGELELQNVNI